MAIETVSEVELDQVIKSVQKAKETQSDWGKKDIEFRLRVIREIQKEFIANKEKIIELVVKDTGKLKTEAFLNEFVVSNELISYYLTTAKSILKTQSVGTGLLMNKRAEIRFEPKGVIGIISPWNYPLVLSLSPVISALIAGNSAILKPSEFTPSVGAYLGELINDVAGLEICQVLVGGPQTGANLVGSGVDMIVFTGSVRGGRAVMQKAAERLTPVLLELGGKDPAIVLDDADLERAAKGCVWGAFTNAGQTCMAIERLYVQESIYDKFLELLVGETNKLRKAIDFAGMIHQRQVDIVKDHVNEAISRGATVICGGSEITVDKRPGFEPTILTGVTHEMRIMREETFGPVLPVMSFRDDHEALKLANDCEFGLNSAVFSNNPKRTEFFVKNLEAGNVCVNDVMVSYAIASLPFGGVKNSGIGRTHGALGLSEMCNIKAVAYNRPFLKVEPQWYPITNKTEAFANAVLSFRQRDVLKFVKALGSIVKKN